MTRASDVLGIRFAAVAAPRASVERLRAMGRGMAVPSALRSLASIQPSPLPGGVLGRAILADLEHAARLRLQEEITGHKERCLIRTMAMGPDFVTCTCGAARRAQMRTLFRTAMSGIQSSRRRRRRSGR